MRAAPTFDAVRLRFPNGARALFISRSNSPTLAIQILVRAGSRHDGDYPGLAHLVEHLVFRAPTPPRADLYGAVESLGGEVGGGTTRDYTSFEVVVGAPHVARALALLPELARGPATDPLSFAGEQLVVCQELRERASLSRTLWNRLLAALWGDDGLTHDPGGSTAGVLSATPGAAADFCARWHQPAHLLAVGAGAGSTEAFMAAATTALGSLPQPDPTAPATAPPSQAPVDGSDEDAAQVGSAQVHLAVGLAVPGLEHPDSAALRLLAAVLVHARQARSAGPTSGQSGFVTFQAQYVPYFGRGVFAVLAVCAAGAAPAVAAMLRAQLVELSRSPPTRAELEGVRARYLGAVYRRCETNASLASLAGVDALFDDDTRPLANTVNRVAAVSGGEVAAVARRYFGHAALVEARLGTGAVT